MTGRIHSFQSLGTLDGPGVRFVVFMQGCHLRCGCCHNPDTWDASGGTPYTPEEVFRRLLRFREYFTHGGGLTVSGGEPLLQAPFVTELFRLSREAGIDTCLDTSGCLLGDEVEALLSVTDRVLLDIKYTEETSYAAYVGCSLSSVLSFLSRLDAHAIPTTLRQVILPGLNDSEESLRRLGAMAEAHPSVSGCELLPFRKLCLEKYEALGIPFRFAHIAEPTSDEVRALTRLLGEKGGRPRADGKKT